MMRYLALDVGNKRVGVAVGSSDVRIATPLCVFERRTPTEDAARLVDLVREYDIEQIVVGLPLAASAGALTGDRMSAGRPGLQEERTRAYAGELAPALGLPILFQDERFSTAAALQQQRARGLTEKRGRATLDANAAAVILQDFLDALRPPDATGSNTDMPGRPPGAGAGSSGEES